jgi:hypothetical protein
MILFLGLAAILTSCLSSTASPTLAPTPVQTSTTQPTFAPTSTPTPDLPPSMGTACKDGITVREELLPTPASSQPQKNTPLPPKATPTAVERVYLSQRAGFGMSIQVEPENWAAQLRSGWYWSWNVKKRGPNQVPEHWQTIRLKTNCFFPSEAYIRWVASHYPGSVWMIGNEPDVIWQDNITPEEYARLYGVLYQIIRSADPTAKISAANISQATPLRLAYLDRVLQAYQASYGKPFPTDWWTIHGYVLREEHNSWGVEIPPGFEVDRGELYEVEDHGNLELFKKQIIAFRNWMVKNGYQKVPLALTEFGILMPNDYGFPIEKVSEYMNISFDWLQNARDKAIGDPADDYRLVQRWAWFSLADPTYPAPNLADMSNDTLTELGKVFQKYVTTFRP